MKVISIIQPWAILLAVGEKRNETRSRRTHYRGELFIHASKKIDRFICNKEPFASALARHGYTADNLPTGVIIARAILTDCLEVMEDSGHWARLSDGDIAKGNEYSFGWYDPGRFAYRLQMPERIEPIPAKGQLGLWNYPLDTSQPSLM